MDVLFFMKYKLKKLIIQQTKDSWSKCILPFIINPLKKSINFNLTLNERVVLALRMCGFGNKEIAQSLKIKRVTVRVIVSQIKSKLGIEKEYKMPHNINVS